MSFQDLPIRRKVMFVIMLTTVAVLVLTTIAFTVYDVISYRRTHVRRFELMAATLAAQSAKSLAEHDPALARELLAGLRADPEVVAAAIYDAQGRPFAQYTSEGQPGFVPEQPGAGGSRIEQNQVVAFEPVSQAQKMLGTVYVRAGLHSVARRLETYAGLAGAVLAGSLAVALLLSRTLERRISRPIMALAETARTVSARRDFAVRAPAPGSRDELGELTEAFNRMLEELQAQTRALAESEARFRTFVEQAADALFVHDEQGRFLDVNRQACESLGYSREELLARKVTDIELDLDEASAQRLWSGLEPGRAVRFSGRQRRKDGSVFPVEIHLSMSVLGGQKMFLAYGRDITEREKAEASRSFLAAIVDSSDAAIVGKDTDGIVVSWNAGAERMFGYSAPEILGRSITKLLAPDRPDEEEKILRQVRAGAILNYETVRQRKDGRLIELALTVSPVRDSQGRIVGVSSIARDITERRQAERVVQESRARLSAIISSAMDAIISVDAQQRVRMFNAAAEKMFGYAAAEVLGEPMERLLPARFRGQHRQDLDAFGRTGASTRAMGHLPPLTALRADGSEFPIEASIAQTEANGEKIYTVIVRDMTEREQAQAEIRRMNQELERRVQERTAELTAANQELESFTYSVAHDLRAPLRHIDAFGRILEEEFSEGLPEEGRRFIQSIRTGSRHMSHLVDDLLNLARVGRQELKREPLPLEQVVQDVVRTLKSEADGRLIEWQIRPLPTVPCDPGLIKQVFTNLLSNAVKYTRPRSPAKIEVGTLTEDGQAVVYVRDNGVGFNMKYADKLFGVFQRLHRSEEFEGTGVGLATVERILRKHGGRVWAEGAMDKGAVFYFTLPGAVPPPPPAPAPASQPPPAA